MGKRSMRAAINAKCSVPECSYFVRSKGLCNRHYLRLSRYGRLHSIQRERGTGTIKNNGYIAVRNNGLTYEHRNIAEAVLVRPMSGTEEIHHVDGNPSNNANSNLVICPSRAYHMLLHKRARALKACGHADWLNCCYCGKHDKPENLKIYSKSPPRHSVCAAKYLRQWRTNGRL